MEHSQISIGSAITLLGAAKLASNRRPVYVKELVRFLKQFSRGNEDKPLTFFDVSQIEAFFAGRKFCPAARRGGIGRVSVLFSFAQRRNWVVENPCRKIEKPITEWTPPTILSPEQAETLMRVTQRDWPERLAYLSLCLFAGLRPSEARQIQWANINCETVRIEANISKIRQRRIVELHPTARAWIAHAKTKSKLPLAESTRQTWNKTFRGILGMKALPQDALRHSCASYLLADRQDAGWVSMQLGNSPNILFRHYRALVTKEDAAKFWAILP